MPRGRPRKVPPVVEKPDTLQWKVAEILAMYCGIPGCMPRMHIEEASLIIEEVFKFNPSKELVN